MALSDLVLPTRTIRVGGAEFNVRGLSFADVGALIQEHRADLERLVESFANGGEENLQAFALNLLQEMPVLVAKVIACASDEPESWEVARRLPVPAQLSALLEIGTLTFEETGGVKKFMADVLTLVGGMNATLSQKPSALPS